MAARVGALVCVLMLVGWGGVVTVVGRPAATAVRVHLPSPSMAEEAKRLVYEAMRSHAREMQRLVLAVVLLDYAETARLAQLIGEQPIFVAKTRERLQRAGVPARFFEQAEVLHHRAALLAAAALTEDADAMAPSFGLVTETCVACHRAYLGDRERTLP